MAVRSFKELVQYAGSIFSRKMRLDKKFMAMNMLITFRSLNGCSEYADSFVSQEIDGQALMLLREEHMVVAMHMKLGPALKIVANVNAMKREALKEHQ